MTSAELKHRVKLQEWLARIQDCRSSGLSVRAWCKQEGVNVTTYYRWERELLVTAETGPHYTNPLRLDHCSGRPIHALPKVPVYSDRSLSAIRCP